MTANRHTPIDRDRAQRSPEYRREKERQLHDWLDYYTIKGWTEHADQVREELAALARLPSR